MSTPRVFIKNCITCGNVFECECNQTRYCPNCRKNPKKSKSKTPTISGNESLSQVLAQLDAYNKKHGTYLTYGKFIVLCNSQK